MGKETQTQATEKAQGKGRPTPTRKQAQARNARPLVGAQSKEARKAAKEEMALRRERARIGMANGEERYLTPRDRGEQRRFIRDWVDARTGIGEFVLPVMFIIVLWTFLPVQISRFAPVAMLGLVAILIIDSFILSFFLGRRLKEKFGKENIQRGYRWYAASRSMQMRVMRLPKPQVKRGQWPA